MQEQPTLSIWRVLSKAFAVLIGLIMLPVIVACAVVSITMSIVGVILTELGKLLLVPVNDMTCAIFAPHQSQLFNVSGGSNIDDDNTDN